MGVGVLPRYSTYSLLLIALCILPGCDRRPTITSTNRGNYVVLQDGSIYHLVGRTMFKVDVDKPKPEAKKSVQIRLLGIGKAAGCTDEYPLNIEFKNLSKRSIAWVKFEIAAHLKDDSERFDAGAAADQTDPVAVLASAQTKQLFRNTSHLGQDAASSFCFPRPLLNANGEGKELEYTPIVVDAAFI